METKFLFDRYFILRPIAVDRFSQTFLAVDLGDKSQRRCAIEMSQRITNKSASQRLLHHVQHKRLNRIQAKQTSKSGDPPLKKPQQAVRPRENFEPQGNAHQDGKARQVATEPDSVSLDVRVFELGSCDLQVLPAALTVDRQHLQQNFEKKIAILQQLSLEQPQIPQIYAQFYTADTCYIVRELITGLTLQQQVRHKGTLHPTEVRKILSSLLQMLLRLHDCDLIHHNIKPENIILRDEDNSPVLVGWGNIEQKPAVDSADKGKASPTIVADSDYAAPEYLIENSLKARDLYSLGLTAIYLLTGSSPQNLQTNGATGRIYLPEAIAACDPYLSSIIELAINPEPNYYYSSATEMLSALQATPSKPVVIQSSSNFSHDNSGKRTPALNFKRNFPSKARKIGKHLVTLSLLITSVAISLFGWISWQNERTPSPISTASQSQKSLRLPSPNAALDNISTVTQKTNFSNTTTDIPIFVTGIHQNQLIDALGQPQAIERGYWANSRALIYKNVVTDTVDVSYLIDTNSGRVKQTEIALAQSLGLATMQQTLSDLLQGKITPAIVTGLRQVYQRQSDTYGFEVDRWEGVIKRIQEDNKDNVYIGIWEEDFH